MGDGRVLINLVIAAFIAGLTGALAQVKFNIGPVPYTMQNMGVMLAGLLLPPSYALFSMILYIVLIAIGLPLAAGFHGGLAVLVGYTGGYLAGFIIAAPIMSMLTRRYLMKRGKELHEINTRDFLIILSFTAIAAIPIYVLGFTIFAYYALHQSPLYLWSKSAASFFKLNVNSELLTIFIASVLIFMPQDIFMDHVLAILVAKGVSKILSVRGI